MRSRDRWGFKLYAWVIMPEHIHLLIIPMGESVSVSKVLLGLKRPVATRVLRSWRVQGIETPPSFWQPGGGHDRNIFSRVEFVEKVEYIHQNPVKRGLVQRPEDWAWSSYRAWKMLETPWATIDRG
jgi:putative transposase